MARPAPAVAVRAPLLAVLAPLLAALALAAPCPSRAADDPGVIPMQVVVGDTASLGIGPVRGLICDDPTLVRPVDTASGPGLLALQVGTTLCSVTDTLSMRRVYRVEVVAAGGGGGSTGKGGSKGQGGP